MYKSRIFLGECIFVETVAHNTISHYLAKKIFLNKVYRSYNKYVWKSD